MINDKKVRLIGLGQEVERFLSIETTSIPINKFFDILKDNNYSNNLEKTNQILIFYSFSINYIYSFLNFVFFDQSDRIPPDILTIWADTLFL